MLKNLQSLSALPVLGMGALGLSLVLFQIVRVSVRAKKRCALQRVKVRDTLEATRSGLLALKEMLSAPSEAPNNRAHADRFQPGPAPRAALVERVEIELFHRVRRYQLARLGKTPEEGRKKVYSTPAIS